MNDQQVRQQNLIDFLRFSIEKGLKPYICAKGVDERSQRNDATEILTQYVGFLTAESRVQVFIRTQSEFPSHTAYVMVAILGGDNPETTVDTRKLFYKHLAPYFRANGGRPLEDRLGMDDLLLFKRLMYPESRERIDTVRAFVG